MVPLRQRKSDILPLARHLLNFFSRESGRHFTSFTPEAETILMDCRWPGNVRELRNSIERAIILSLGPTIGVAELPSHVVKPLAAGVEVGAPVTLAGPAVGPFAAGDDGWPERFPNASDSF